jgi:hypothetical protein
LLRFRTLEKIGCPRSQRNEAFQRVAVVTVALLVLLDARNYRDLPLLQFARFFIVLVLFSPPARGRWS